MEQAIAVACQRSLEDTTFVEANTVWQDTGAVETINAFIPVGTPTPMRAGATVIGLWAPGAGYLVISCECREYPAVAGY